LIFILVVPQSFLLGIIVSLILILSHTLLITLSLWQNCCLFISKFFSWATSGIASAQRGYFYSFCLLHGNPLIKRSHFNLFYLLSLFDSHNRCWKSYSSCWTWSSDGWRLYNSIDRFENSIVHNRWRLTWLVSLCRSFILKLD
jgi:hypothetical protein